MYDHTDHGHDDDGGDDHDHDGDHDHDHDDGDIYFGDRKEMLSNLFILVILWISTTMTEN